VGDVPTALRRLRRERGLSQGALALRMGVARQQVCSLETPGRNMTLRSLRLYVEGLGGSVCVRVTIDGKIYELSLAGFGAPSGHRVVWQNVQDQ
jgi:transcriptional regulator with XRE-family HTH domain